MVIICVLKPVTMTFTLKPKCIYSLLIFTIIKYFIPAPPQINKGKRGDIVVDGGNEPSGHELPP